jgi:hypothetical protein
MPFLAFTHLLFRKIRENRSSDSHEALDGANATLKTLGGDDVWK